MAYASLYASGSYLQAVSVGNGIAGLAVTVSSLVITLPGVANACSTALSLTTRVASDDITAAHTRDIITASDDMTAAHARTSLPLLQPTSVSLWLSLSPA